MSSALIVATVLAVAAALGAWRTARATHAHKTLRILLQLVAAALVYFLLFPPSTDERFDSAAIDSAAVDSTTVQYKPKQPLPANVTIRAKDGDARSPQAYPRRQRCRLSRPPRTRPDAARKAS